jgi:hypothetical protein
MPTAPDFRAIANALGLSAPFAEALARKWYAGEDAHRGTGTVDDMDTPSFRALLAQTAEALDIINYAQAEPDNELAQLNAVAAAGILLRCGSANAQDAACNAARRNVAARRVPDLIETDVASL